MLKINHLTKTFGDKTAVDDLTLHIATGEIYGFAAGLQTYDGLYTGQSGSL